MGGVLGLLPLGAFVSLVDERVPAPDHLEHLHEWVVTNPSFVARQPWREFFAPALPPLSPSASTVRVPQDYNDIRTALASLDPEGEGTVELGPGTHYAVPFGERRLRIVGSEGARTVLRAVAPGCNVITASLGAKVTLRGLTLTGATGGDSRERVAAVAAVGADVRLEGCILADNSLDCVSEYGAALYADSGGTIKAVNCLIVANGAELGTPAVRVGPGGFIRLDQCTVVGNVVSQCKPGFGTIAGAAGGTIEVTRCIVWGNTAAAISSHPYHGLPSTEYLVTHSAIQGGYPGERNTDAPPRFRDPFRGDFRLRDDTPVPWAGAMPLIR